ncbi:MAG: TIGR01621 family pseudouridine synthase [Cellvibrionaceae bacterium]|nr:TIGR01621 family pseudouridine synthase [Cellvibrionaceae bacterium]
MVGQAFQILALEPGFIVLNKGSGIGFHDELQDDQRQLGLHSLLQAYCQAEGLGQVYPVHRLDKGTSGLILFARSQRAAAELSEAFAQRQVEKFYLALSDRKPKKKQGLIVGDMAKARRSAYKLLPSKGNPARTRFNSQSLGAGVRLFTLRPHTGKTHQLRVALKSIGSPILGDELYGGSPAPRLYLHAWALAFTYQGRDYRYCQAPQADASPFGWSLAEPELAANLAAALAHKKES